MPLWNWEKWPHNFLPLERDLWEINGRIPAFCRGVGKGAVPSLSTASFLPPSLTFLLNGDWTPVSRGLSHFVCILTVILRFAAERQFIKVFPLKRGRSRNNQLKDIWGRDLLNICYHYLRLIEIHCSSTSVLPLGKFSFYPHLGQQIGCLFLSWPVRSKSLNEVFQNRLCLHWNAELGCSPLCTRIKNSPEWCSKLGRRQDAPQENGSLAHRTWIWWFPDAASR